MIADWVLFFSMCLFGYMGMRFMVWLMRAIEFFAESVLTLPEPPREGHFVTRWVYDDEEIIIKQRR